EDGIRVGHVTGVQTCALPIFSLPVYRLLGGKASPEAPANKEFTGQAEIGIPTRDGIRLKFVVGAVEPVIAAQRARAMVERGWKAIKDKVGRDLHPHADVDRLKAVRDAIGDTWLSVDANGGYTVDQAVWVASR